MHHLSAKAVEPTPPAAPPPVLEVEHVTKSYPTRIGRRIVIRDLSLTLPRGRNVGLIGPNGAGKSTLMRLLGGVEAPDSGRITTRGRVSWPIGLAGGLQGSLTGRDNALFVCRIHAAGGEAMRETVRWVQAFSEVGPAFDLPVKTYSSGMRSRLLFALAMAFDFDLLLIDEMTAVGDAGFRRKSRDALEARLDRAQIVYTSHNVDEVARLCNAVVLLRPGLPAQCFDDVREGIHAYRRAGHATATAAAAATPAAKPVGRAAAAGRPRAVREGAGA